MSLPSHELQVQMRVPIWPYFKLERNKKEEGIEITLSAYVRREIEGVMYKTLSQLRYILYAEEDEKVVIDELTIKFHDYCYKVLILGKPSMQEVDKDTRTELVRLAQELI